MHVRSNYPRRWLTSSPAKSQLGTSTLLQQGRRPLGTHAPSWCSHPTANPAHLYLYIPRFYDFVPWPACAARLMGTKGSQPASPSRQAHAALPQQTNLSDQPRSARLAEVPWHLTTGRNNGWASKVAKL